MKRAFLILIFFLSLKASASHIVGGEMIYDDLGNGDYKITLKLYRDCFNGQAPFDGSNSPSHAFITIYAGSQNLIGLYDIGDPVITTVPPAFSSPCIQVPNTTCIEQGLYTYTINLPPIAGGYDVIYQTCCRNAATNNIVNPASGGITCYAHITGSDVLATNSSPRFTQVPPIYICNGRNFVFNHSATDPDGDQLVYSLCSPYNGASACCPSINGPPNQPGGNCISPPSSCPTEAPPPPYIPVMFQSPYSASYPIASSVPFSIDPNTGIFSGTPNLSGQWLFGVCVQEFRNNQLIETHFRDFQVTVINCSVAVQGVITDQGTLNSQIHPGSVNPQCQGLKIDFVNQSINQSTSPVYHWDFGVLPLTTDTSNLVSPSYTYADTGTYVVTLIVNPGKACADTVKKTMYIYPPLLINFKAPNDQCLKNNSFSFSPQGTFLPQSTFNWNFTSNATPSTSTLKNPVNIVYNQSGHYQVTLIAKQFACRDTFIDTIYVIPRPVAKINNLPAILCDPATVAFSNGSSSELPLKYYWHFSNGFNSTAYEPVQVFTPSGVYGVTLTVVTDSVCQDTSMFSITNLTVNPLPHAGFTFSPQVTSIFDPGITINNAASSDVLYWQYLFGDGTDSPYPYEYHVYQEYGDYVIKQTVTNKFGCTDELEQVVKILPEYRFWAPNAFTPDENLLNDYFMPIAIGVINYDFEIFDRWGERVFKTKNPKQGWNGVYRSQQCQEGIYAWKVTFTNVVSQQEEVHYGHVTLLRNQ